MQVFLRARGFSDAEVGYLQGVMALAGVVGPIAVGHLADRFGRRRWALLACVALFAAVLPPLNATTVFLPAAILAAGIGLFGRTAIPLTDTLASCELPEPTRDYGRVRVWGSIGFVLTLVVIRVFGLIDESSSTSIMTAMLVTAGLCFLSSSALPDHHRARREAEAQADTGGGFDAVFWLFVFVALTHRLGMSAYYFFFTNYLRDVLKMEQAAWVWCIGAAAEIPLLFAGGWVIRRFGIPAMLMASLAAVSVRLCVYAWAPVLAVILPVQVLHALTFGAFHAASIEFLRRKVPAARRGVAVALYMSLSLGVSNWIGSSVGGVIVEHWGYASLYLIYSFPPLVGLACVALARKKLRLAEG